MELDPVVRERGEGETIQGPAGGPLTYKARAAETAGGLTAFENVIAPGDGPPLHSHEIEGESWYILEGTLRFKLGSEIREAPEGSFVHVPAGTPHCFQNVAQQPARILVLFTPGGMEGFFERFSQFLPGTSAPEAFQEAASGAGMTVLGPPLAISDPIPRDDQDS